MTATAFHMAANVACLSTDSYDRLRRIGRLRDCPLVASSSPELASLLLEQEGMVARWQALACGMSEYEISHRLGKRVWRLHHPGVYAAFSGNLTPAARLWLALLACSRIQVHPTQTRDQSSSREQVTLPPQSTTDLDAVLSHETAAHLLGIGGGVDTRHTPSSLVFGAIHVTIPSGRRRPTVPTGVVVHFSARLEASRHPAMSPPRTRVEDTVIDLTQTSPTLDDAISWLTMACGSRRTTAERLAAAIRARKKLRWRRELLYALDDAAAGDHSLLELRYHRNVERAHGLPSARRQRPRKTAPSLGHGRGHARSEYDDVTYDDYGTVVHLDGRPITRTNFATMPMLCGTRIL